MSAANRARKPRDTQNSDVEPSGFLTEKEAGREIKIAPRTLKAWRNSSPPKGPPCLYLGRFVRYPRTGLKAWLAAQPKGGESVTTNPAE
jgi:hypothetical protein